MGKIIVSLIALAILAAIGMAGAYFGGSVIDEGTVKAKATSYGNQAAQIQGAIDLYRSQKGAFPATLNDLVTAGYLRSSNIQIEGANAWSFEQDYVVTTGVSERVCIKILKETGWESTGWTEAAGVPNCPASGTNPYPRCCNQ